LQKGHGFVAVGIFARGIGVADGDFGFDLEKGQVSQ
jgi:hypothetical protein